MQVFCAFFCKKKTIVQNLHNSEAKTQNLKKSKKSEAKSEAKSTWYTKNNIIITL